MPQEDESKRESSMLLHVGEETNATSENDSSVSEYFDRERWHDVETEDELRREVERDKWLTYTTFSVAVLLLVALITGVLAAYSFHRVSLPEESVSPPADFRFIPTQWIGYAQESVAFCVELDDPVCFAAARDGTIFVGDIQPPRLHCFERNGKPIRIVPLDETPRSLAVGKPETPFAGKILVAYSKSLAFYTFEGEKVFQWSLPEGDHDIGSVALAEDSVFAADSRNKIVYRWDQQGTLLNSFGHAATGPSVEAADDENDAFRGFVVFRSPIALTVSPTTGIVYVANPGRHRIEAFTQDGYWEASLSWESASSDITGFAGCCNPVDIVCLDDGRLVTAEKSITRVKVLHPGGKLDWIVAGPGLLDTRPKNIPQLSDWMLRSVSDNNDRPVFIAAIDREAILVFDPVLRIVRCFMPSSVSKESAPLE